MRIEILDRKIVNGEFCSTVNGEFSEFRIKILDIRYHTKDNAAGGSGDLSHQLFAVSFNISGILTPNSKTLHSPTLKRYYSPTRNSNLV